jgi:adenylate cyclase
MIAIPPAMHESNTTQNPVILVIEDSPELSQVLQAQLEFNDFSPVCVEDGSTALKWLAHHQADLIILDIMLPGWDGIKVCEHIRRKYSLGELPVLMLSALGGRASDRVRGLNAGANDFLAKPYDLAELVARIRLLLNVKDEHSRSETMLSRYLAPAIRAQALFNPDMLARHEVPHAVVLFADLRGFTRLSTQTDLYSLTDMLDQFFGRMMAIVNHHRGLVLDLSGDELLAVFNITDDLPDAICVAVRAAVDMQTSFWNLQEKWAEIGLKVGLGIGIHHGEVMLGNVGGQELMRFTVTGSVVNLAHRLVEIAQPGEIIASAEVFDLAQPSLKDSKFVRLPPITLKGIHESQLIYKLDTAGSTIGQRLEVQALFENMIDSALWST